MDETMTTFTARVKKTLKKSVKIYCAKKEVTIEDFFDEALSDRLKKGTKNEKQTYQDGLCGL